MAARVRVLGLGNEILADDALGILAARELARLYPPAEVEVIESSQSGLHLLDYVTGVDRLVVIDTVQTGRAAPGEILVVREQDVRSAPGTAAHGTGLFDALAVARQLGFPVPADVVILAVEAADCLTLGGSMHPAVAAALPQVVAKAQALIRNPR
ncbi:MAG: hydrogenase maturation protease [Bryobacteraceae bacterium]